MKKIIMIFGLLAFAIAPLYAQTDYLQWEVMNIVPKMDKLDLFKKGVAAHNKKYHAANPHKVTVWSVITGPASGSYTWVMGATTWTQMDSRPGAGEHQLDWDKNVLPYCESMGEVTYWRNEKDLTYQAADEASFTKMRIRNNYVYPGEMDRYLGLMKMISQVYKKKNYASSFTVGTRQGASQGPHVASFNSFSKWSWLDNTTNFRKDYDEVHGSGAYDKFLKEFELCIDRSKTYDELVELVPELGG
jgi:hypothetical protein